MDAGEQNEPARDIHRVSECIRRSAKGREGPALEFLDFSCLMIAGEQELKMMHACMGRRFGQSNSQNKKGTKKEQKGTSLRHIYVS